MKKILSSFLLLFCLAGCAHSTIIPFQAAGGNKPKTYPPTQAEDVGIYRSTHPFSSFIELGMITYRAYAFDLYEMYNQIRKDAAEYGAQAVVDVKITGETHTEYVMKNICTPHTTCDATGICSTNDECHTDQVPTEVSTFLIAGSMIRGKP